MERKFYVDRTVYAGRPTDQSNRAAVELKTYDLLDSLGIAYDRVDHDAAMTIADCVEIDALLGTPMCKNLFLTNKQQTEFYLLLMPGKKKYRAGELARQIGTARLSFADASYMERFLSIRPGAVTVMGLLNDTDKCVRLLIDRDVAAAPFICCHPCVNTVSLRIKTEDLLNIFLPHVAHAPTFVTLQGEEL